MELSVYAAEYLDWWPHSNQTLLTPRYLHCILTQPHHFILLEGKQRRVAVLLLVVSEQSLDDPFCKLYCTEVREMKVLMGCCEFLAFLHELIDGNSLYLDSILIIFHGNNCLIAQPNILYGINDAARSQVPFLGCLAKVRLGRFDS